MIILYLYFKSIASQNKKMHFCIRSTELDFFYSENHRNISQKLDILIFAESEPTKIYNYLCNQCISLLTLWVQTLLRRRVLEPTLCDKVCQWLATGRWFFPVSATNKTGRHNIAEILLKLALNIITVTRVNQSLLLQDMCLLGNQQIPNSWYS